MTIINLNEEQAEDIGARLSAFDEQYISYKMNGRIRIGMEDGGKLIAGYRRKGIGARLVRETEKRAAAMGVNAIRLDTFNWQGKEFYEALGYTAVGHYDHDEDGFSEYFFLKRLS